MEVNPEIVSRYRSEERKEKSRSVVRRWVVSDERVDKSGKVGYGKMIVFSSE
jgi:hypothetical protein